MDVSVQIQNVVGRQRFRGLIPATLAGWGASGLGALLRGCFGTQLVVAGGALTGRNPKLSFETARGLTGVMRFARRREPFLSLGGLGSGQHPLAPFFARLGLEAAEECRCFRSTNGLFVLFGRCDNYDAVALMATDATTEERIAAHIRGLVDARNDLNGSVIARMMPEILRSNRDHVVETRLMGRQQNAKSLSQAELARALRAGLRTAKELAKAAPRRRAARSARLVPPEFLSALDIVPLPARADIVTALEALGEWAREQALMGVPMHGDLWLENLFFDDTYSRVTGVIDWEDYDPCGPPLLDAIRLVVTSVAAHRGVPIATILAQIWLREDAFLGSMFDEICAVFQVSMTMLEWLGIAAWFSYIAAGLREPRPRNFDLWMTSMCDIPAAAVGKWLAQQQRVAAE